MWIPGSNDQRNIKSGYPLYGHSKSIPVIKYTILYPVQVRLDNVTDSDHQNIKSFIHWSRSVRLAVDSIQALECKLFY